MVKEVGRKVIAQNKKARHDYSIEDVFECGMVLTGTEVKSLRLGRASLIDGFAMINDGELWLSGVHIPEYTEGTWTNHTPRRDRKLLVHNKGLCVFEDWLAAGADGFGLGSSIYKPGMAVEEIETKCRAVMAKLR